MSEEYPSNKALNIWFEVAEHTKGWAQEDYEKAIRKIDPEKSTFELLQTIKHLKGEQNGHSDGK